MNKSPQDWIAGRSVLCIFLGLVGLVGLAGGNSGCESKERNQERRLAELKELDMRIEKAKIANLKSSFESETPILLKLEAAGDPRAGNFQEGDFVMHRLAAKEARPRDYMTGIVTKRLNKERVLVRWAREADGYGPAKEIEMSVKEIESSYIWRRAANASGTDWRYYKIYHVQTSDGKDPPPIDEPGDFAP
jgi:hypothetical protein